MEKTTCKKETKRTPPCKQTEASHKISFGPSTTCSTREVYPEHVPSGEGRRLRAQYTGFERERVGVASSIVKL